MTKLELVVWDLIDHWTLGFGHFNRVSDHPQQSSITSALGAAPLSEFDEQAAKTEMTRDQNRARLERQLSHNEMLDQKPQEQYTPQISSESSPSHPASSEGAASSAATSSTQQPGSEVVSGTAKVGQQQARRAIAEHNERSDRLNSTGIMRPINTAYSLINQKKIRAIENGLSKKVAERKKTEKEMSRLKRKVRWRIMRIIFELVVLGIGWAAALMEFEKLREQREKIKTDKKKISEINKEIEKLETQKYNLENLFKRQNALEYAQNQNQPNSLNQQPRPAAQ